MRDQKDLRSINEKGSQLDRKSRRKLITKCLNTVIGDI